MDEQVRRFLEANHSAAMTTLRQDGTPHTARVAVALVGDRLWSSSTEGRLRTRFLRCDPRCTLFVFPQQGAQYLSLETTVTILDGPDVPDLSIELFRVMQPEAPVGMLTWNGKQLTHEAFRQAMRDDHRLLYQFEVQRAYGIY